MTSITAVGADAVQRLVEEALSARLGSLAASAVAHGPAFEQLWRSTIERTLGGKLIRPRLLLDTFFAFAPRSARTQARAEAAVEVATTVELMHFAFLLHDDVIDGDLVRRGRPNLIGAIAMDGMSAAAPLTPDQALHWGRTGALLMGDLMLTSSLLQLSRLDVPPAVRARLVDLVEHVVAETIAGEHADVSFSDGAVSPDLPAILRMTTQKTAAYSFELPLRAAAVLSGASEEAEAAIAGIGRRLGLAYQLQDDLLSVFADSQQHGKDAFSDLRSGKETAIIAYARMTSAWPAVEARFGADDLTDEECAVIRDRLRDCGAEPFVRNLVEENLAEARAAIARDDVLPRAVRQTLTALTARIDGRRA